MDRGLRAARATAAVATVVLLPLALGAIDSRRVLVLAILDAAVLALATAYAYYLGIYRYTR